MTLFIILYIVGVIVAYPLIKVAVLTAEKQYVWSLKNRVIAIFFCIVGSWATALIGLVIWFLYNERDKKVKW